MNDTPVKFAAPRRVESPEGCFFYHTVELPGFGVVRGQWDLRGHFEEYVGGVGVKGRSVLDVGAATGFLSFEAERLGASRVVSHDMSDVRQQRMLPFKDKPYFSDPERWAAVYGAEMESWKDAYWLCHRLLGSRAEVFYGDVYDLPPSLGRFDVVLVGSVLEHLSDQVTALASVSRVTGETMVVVTPLLETDERVARFEPRAANPAQDYTWWTYSLGVYREVFGMLGFRVERVTKGRYFYDHAGRWEERATLVAVRERG
ncbi:MAG TPA: class I SAM-dependent methyltransferase [Pyrinomonadaceae bacterium]